MMLLYVLHMNHSFFRDGSGLGDYPQIFLDCLRSLRYSMEKFSFSITVVGLLQSSNRVVFIKKQNTLNIFIMLYEIFYKFLSPWDKKNQDGVWWPSWILLFWDIKMLNVDSSFQKTYKETHFTTFCDNHFKIPRYRSRAILHIVIGDLKKQNVETYFTTFCDNYFKSKLSKMLSGGHLGYMQISRVVQTCFSCKQAILVLEHQ